MDKCFLCDSDSYMVTNAGAYIDIIDGNRLDIDFDSPHVPEINIEINFCPICGRKLENTKDKGYTIKK